MVEDLLEFNWEHRGCAEVQRESHYIDCTRFQSLKVGFSFLPSLEPFEIIRVATLVPQTSSALNPLTALECQSLGENEVFVQLTTTVHIMILIPTWWRNQCTEQRREVPKGFLCACSLWQHQDGDSKSLRLVFFPSYHAASLLLSSGVCGAWEQELGVGGSATSCKKRWELGSSVKPLLSEHVLLWWWRKPAMGMKRKDIMHF